MPTNLRGMVRRRIVLDVPPDIRWEGKDEGGGKGEWNALSPTKLGPKKKNTPPKDHYWGGGPLGLSPMTKKWTCLLGSRRRLG